MCQILVLTHITTTLTLFMVPCSGGQKSNGSTGFSPTPRGERKLRSRHITHHSNRSSTALFYRLLAMAASKDVWDVTADEDDELEDSVSARATFSGLSNRVHQSG